MADLGNQLINQSYQNLLQITSSNAVQKGNGQAVNALAITSSTTSDIAPAITNNTNNRVLTATGGGTINGEAGLTFNGSDLDVTGNVTAGSTVDTTNLTVNGYVNTNLSPTDATYNLTLGESSRTWNQVHVGAGNGSRTAFFGEDLLNNPGQIFIRTDYDLAIRANGGLDIQATTTIPTLLNDTLTNNASISTPSLTATNLRATNSASIGGNFVPQARLHISGANNQALLEIDSPAVNNILFVSGSGNVGIGLASPLARLHTSGSNALRMQNTGFDTFEWFFNAGTGIGFRNVTDGTTPFFVGGTDDIGIGTTNTSARLHVSGASDSNLLRVGSPAQANILFVTGSGNIGVGTTTPGVTLDVVGQIRASSTMFNSTTQTNTIQLSSATNLQFLSASVETARYDSNGWGFFNTAPTAKVHISGANADALFRASSPTTTGLFVSGSGRVGIGTTNPRAALHISAGDISLDGTRYLDWANGDNRIIGGSAGGYSLQFQTWTGAALTEKMRISGSGEVGIGTTNPQRRLHIDASGSANTNVPLLLTSVDTNNRVGILFASSSLSAGRKHNLFNRVNTPTVEWILGTNAGETAQWIFIPRDDTNYAITLRTPFNGGTAQITTGLSQSLFSLGAGGTGNQHLNISSSGNVGIGTTTPTSLLQVAGRVTSTELYVINGDAIYTTNGSVGIGTSGPTSTNRLQVRGSGATSLTTAFRVENSNASASLTILDDGTSAFNTSHLYVSSSGLVGVGTALPTAKLHISGANADALFRVSSPSATNALFVTGSGRVAVGTTTPQRLFDVYNGANPGIAASFGAQMGNNNFSGISFGYVEQANALYRKSALVFERTETHGGGSNASGKIHFLLNNNSSTSATAITDAVLTIDSVGTTAGTSRVGIGTRFPTASLHISGTVATDNLMRVQSTTGAEYFFISASGNVGIGTTNPQAILHISGSTSGSILEPTSSGVPTFTGRDGQFIFGSSGGNHFIYVYMAGAWRSSSLS